LIRVKAASVRNRHCLVRMGMTASGRFPTAFLTTPSPPPPQFPTLSPPAMLAPALCNLVHIPTLRLPVAPACACVSSTKALSLAAKWRKWVGRAAAFVVMRRSWFRPEHCLNAPRARFDALGARLTLPVRCPSRASRARFRGGSWAESPCRVPATASGSGGSGRPAGACLPAWGCARPCACCTARRR